MQPRRMESLAETPLLQRIAAACWREEGIRAPAHVGDPAWDLNQHLDKLEEATVWIWEGAAYAADFGGLTDIVIVPSRRVELIGEVLERAGVAVVVPELDDVARAALAERRFQQTNDHVTLQLACRL